MSKCRRRKPNSEERRRGRLRHQVRDIPVHLRVKVRRHHNNRGDFLIKGDVVFQRLCRFAEKHGLKVAGAE